MVHDTWSSVHLAPCPPSSCFVLTRSGIGLETSLQFAAEGARVVLSDKDATLLNAAVEQVRTQFPSSEAIGVTCDVSKEAEVKAMIDAAVDKFGRLDVLVSSCCVCRELGGAGKRCCAAR